MCLEYESAFHYQKIDGDIKAARVKGEEKDWVNYTVLSDDMKADRYYTGHTSPQNGAY